MMGGRLWLESELGTGSIFHFTANFGLALSDEQKSVSLPLEVLEGMPVLVVDDNATNRRIHEEMFAHWKMRPVLASGGHEALSLVKEAEVAGRRFPLIIVDAHMPEVDGFAVVREIRNSPALASTTILMLSSNQSKEDAARCSELGIASYLLKPVMESELLSAILRALGKWNAPLASGVEEANDVNRPSRVLRILLAEDNPVNRQLALRVLQKKGHQVNVASDGREVLEALKKYGRAAFDLVLMDVQMPEMDGLQATSAIRIQEEGTGTHLPIIAITAHAMKGDDDRCRAAGMDGYVTKPLRAAELFREMDRCLAAFGSPPPLFLPPPADDRPPLEQPGTEGDALDRAALMERVDGDMELLAELVQLFSEDSTRQIDELRRAIEKNDATAVARSAHALKGVLGNLAADRGFAAASVLEQMGRQGNLAGALDGLEKLVREIEVVTPLLLELCGEVAK
jgi:CheY-like chemotaxis protein